MKANHGMRFFAVGAIVCAAAMGQAPDAQARGDSNRMENRFGIYASVLGDPGINLWGVNAAYNILDFMRAHVGYGSVPEITNVDPTSGATVGLAATSYGGGVDFFVPGWNFSPTLGLGYSILSLTGSGSFQGISVSSGLGSVSMLEAKGGFDWSTGSGFNLAAGAKLTPLTGDLSSSSQVIPYVHLGWYF